MHLDLFVHLFLSSFPDRPGRGDGGNCEVEAKTGSQIFSSGIF